MLLGLAHRTQVEGWSKKVAYFLGEMDIDKICKVVDSLPLSFMIILIRIVKEEPAKMVQLSLATPKFSSSQQQGGRR